MTSSPGVLLPAKHINTDRCHITWMVTRRCGFAASDRAVAAGGSHLVLGADFGSLRDFAPSGPRGLFHPR